MIKLFINWCFGKFFIILGLSMVKCGWMVGERNVNLFCVFVLVMIVLVLDLELVVGRVKIVLIGVVCFMVCCLVKIF